MQIKNKKEEEEEESKILLFTGNKQKLLMKIVELRSKKKIA